MGMQGRNVKGRSSVKRVLHKHLRSLCEKCGGLDCDLCCQTDTGDTRVIPASVASAVDLSFRAPVVGELTPELVQQWIMSCEDPDILVKLSRVASQRADALSGPAMVFISPV